MSVGTRELELWDGTSAFILEGAADEPERPPLHLQAARGGYLRLVGPDGPLLWGLVDPEWWGVDFVRSATSRIKPLPPIRLDEVDGVGDGASAWTRYFAMLLSRSASTPIARGRQYLFAPMEAVSSAPAGAGSADSHRRKWPPIAPRPKDLEELASQRESFELQWDFGYIGLLLTRPLSEDSDGRVKMWRKRAREGRLPPLVVWWCNGLFAHVLLDGHDRLHAALLENTQPSILVLADVSPRGRDDIEAKRMSANEAAASVETIPSVSARANAMNALLRDGWDPRAEWNLATPGFPLDLKEWTEEVRGTALEKLLATER